MNAFETSQQHLPGSGKGAGIARGNTRINFAFLVQSDQLGNR
jgi:hypothetical protein